MVLTLDYDHMARMRKNFFHPIYDFLFNMEKFGICDVLKKIMYPPLIYILFSLKFKLDTNLTIDRILS